MSCLLPSGDTSRDEEWSKWDEEWKGCERYAHSTHTRRRPGSARGAKGRRTGRVGHRSLHSSLVTFGARHVSPTGMVRREERSVENSRWTRLTLWVRREEGKTSPCSGNEMERKMQRLDWSLSRKVTQDIKTQPQINHYQSNRSVSLSVPTALTIPSPTSRLSSFGSWGRESLVGWNIRGSRWVGAQFPLSVRLLFPSHLVPVTRLSSRRHYAPSRLTARAERDDRREWVRWRDVRSETQERRQGEMEAEDPVSRM